MNELDHCYTKSIECSGPWPHDRPVWLAAESQPPTTGSKAGACLLITCGPVHFQGELELLAAAGVAPAEESAEELSSETHQGQLVPGLELRQFWAVKVGWIRLRQKGGSAGCTIP